jgi:hypothetical protein
MKNKNQLVICLDEIKEDFNFLRFLLVQRVCKIDLYIWQSYNHNKEKKTIVYFRVGE